MNITSTTQLKQFLEGFAKVETVYTLTEDEWTLIKQTARDKFESFAWVYGLSPLTKITRGDITITVEDGIISAISDAKNNQKDLQKLIGVSYCIEDIKKALTQYGMAEKLLNSLF